MNVPDGLRYSKDHEWVRVEGDVATVGITDYAQDALGDVVYVDPPMVGSALNAGDSSYGKFRTEVYTELAGSDEKGQGGHAIDLCRYQVANGYMGRAGLINSGGASGSNDMQQAIQTAVINKRAGGMGLISGRKAFQRPMNEGVGILNAIQDVYLDDSVTIA